MEFETLESGIKGKWYRKHWKVELLEYGIGNIGKWKHQKIKLMVNEIIGKWNRIYQKMD